jgi:hypothetical protein
MESLYSRLGVATTATTEEIRRSYRRLAARHHPDATRDAEGAEFRRIREAYEVLSDDERRAAYDLWLRLDRAATREQGTPRRPPTVETDPRLTAPAAPARPQPPRPARRPEKRAGLSRGWVFFLHGVVWTVVPSWFLAVLMDGEAGDAVAVAMILWIEFAAGGGLLILLPALTGELHLRLAERSRTAGQSGHLRGAR